MSTKLGLYGGPITNLAGVSVAIGPPVISGSGPHTAASVNIFLTPATTTSGSLIDYNILLNGIVDANVIERDASGSISIPVKYGNRTYNVVIRGNNSLGESADSNQVTATTLKTPQQEKAENLADTD